LGSRRQNKRARKESLGLQRNSKKGKNSFYERIQRLRTLSEGSKESIAVNKKRLSRGKMNNYAKKKTQPKKKKKNKKGGAQSGRDS